MLLVVLTASPAAAGGNQTLTNSWAAINYATAGAIALGALRGPAWGGAVAPVAPAWGAVVVTGGRPGWGGSQLPPGRVLTPTPWGWEARQVVGGCYPAAANPFVGGGSWICGGQFAR